MCLTVNIDVQENSAQVLVNVGVGYDHEDYIWIFKRYKPVIFGSGVQILLFCS